MGGITDNVTAADIGKGPLENAEKTIKKYSLEGKIDTCLSDGLEKISEKNNVRFYISINGDENAIPDFIQKYV